MVNLDVLKTKFPPLPESQGSYLSVQLEPIILSGERITVIAAAKMNSGEFRVVQTISKETLLCMYGGQSQSVQGLISVISDDLTAWLSSEGSLFDYKPPYQNSFVTEIETMHS